MSFKQVIFILLYLFILDAPEPTEWSRQLRDDVFAVLSSDTFEDFRIMLIRKALPYSSKRINFYNDFLKFVDRYLKL